MKVIRCPKLFPSPATCSIAHLHYFQCVHLVVRQPCSTWGGPGSAMEDEWVRRYHLTNKNVFEGSSIALSDLFLINAVLLWDSVWAEMVEEAKHTRTHPEGTPSQTQGQGCVHANSYIPRCYWYSLRVPQQLMSWHKHTHTLEVFHSLCRFSFFSRTKLTAYIVTVLEFPSLAKHNVFGDLQCLSVAPHYESTKKHFICTCYPAEATKHLGMHASRAY